MAQAPRVLLIGMKIGLWVCLREASLRLCGYSQELKGLRQGVFESAVLEFGMRVICAEASPMQSVV